MATPLLTICIPTYNRASFLELCLQSIVSQFDGQIDSKVEVVVSDNASLDDTGAVAANYQNKYSNVRYFKNGQNLGFDENVIASVARAQGEYCWWLGDDDLLVPGSLAFVLDFLSTRQAEVIAVQTQNFSSYGEVKSQPKKFSQSQINYFNTPEEFFDYCRGILSVFVFSKDLWQKVNHDDYEIGWSYFEAIYKMLPLSQKKFVNISTPVVYTKDDSAWVKGGTEIQVFINLKKLWEKLPQSGYRQVFVDGKTQGMQKALLLILLRAKGHDLKCNFRSWQKIYQAFSKHKFYLALAFLIFIMPNWLVKVIREAKHLIIPKDRARAKLKKIQV